MYSALKRRFCGCNTADNLKRQLIYKLAIGDATRSELVKSLPHDLSKFDQLQEILDMVAVYSNPSGFNQGMYSLRWAFWKELDLYHPFWNLKDLQVAEERYLHFRGVSAMTTQLPRWTKIYPPLEGIARIATCRVTLQIIRAVLFYFVFTESRSLDAFASEGISESLNDAAGKQSLLSLLVALLRMHRQENKKSYLESSNCSFSYLIESLLRKFAEVDAMCMNKLQELAPEVVIHVSKSPNSDRTTSSSASNSELHKAKAREKQAVMLAKMKAAQSKFLSSITSAAADDSESDSEMSNSNAEHETEGSVQQSCSLCHDTTSKSLVSFLILLQLTENPVVELHNDEQGQRGEVNVIPEFVKSRFLSVKNNESPSTSDCDGIYLSSCGHAVHQGCLDRYLSSLKKAVFLCCGKDEYNINELGSLHSLITDVCDILGGFDCARWYFVSNDIDRPCHIKEMIRRLSLPYLRRCAFLWKLLKSSAAAPSCDSDTVLESSHVLTDMLDKTEITSLELNEVQELENMFRIPPINVILEDKVSRSFAIKWSHHFQKAHEVCSFQNVFYYNPAVPFKLMTLPHVYQDLFHRFVKNSSLDMLSFKNIYIHEKSFFFYNYVQQCCPDCKDALDEPALCLLRGRLRSASCKTCCSTELFVNIFTASESGCKTHAMTCGAGTGVFLLIRTTTISLQIYAKQAPWPSPYLDAFGEEDIKMRRGKPLYLNQERFAALSYIVASHGQTSIGTFFMA
ncbi:hypothetical protein V6N13_072661 [Hibiscus sabdariffa]